MKRLNIERKFGKKIYSLGRFSPIGNLEILTAHGDSYALHYIDNVIDEKDNLIPSQINIELDYHVANDKTSKRNIVGTATVRFISYKENNSDRISVVFSKPRFSNNNARWESYKIAYILKSDFKKTWLNYSEYNNPTLTVIVESLKNIAFTDFTKSLKRYPINSQILPDGSSMFERIKSQTNLTKLSSKSDIDKEFTDPTDTIDKETVKEVIDNRNKIENVENTTSEQIARALDEIKFKDEEEATADILEKINIVNSKMQETYEYFTPPEYSLKINSRDLNESIFETYTNYMDEISRDVVAYKAEIATDRFKPLPSRNGNIAWHKLTEQEQEDVINGEYPGPFIHDEIFETATTLKKGGIALYGPPGTGKSEQIVRVGQKIGVLYGVKVHEVQPDCNYETLFPKKAVIDDVDEYKTVAKTELDESKGIYKYIRNGGVLIFNEYSQISGDIQTVFSEFLTKPKDSVGRVINVNGVELKVHKNFWIFATLNRPQDTIGKVSLSSYIMDRFKIFNIGNSFDAFINSSGLANAAQEQLSGLITRREVANSGEEYYSIRNILKNHVGTQNQRAIIDYVHKKHLGESSYEALSLDLLGKSNEDLTNISNKYEVTDKEIEDFILACDELFRIFNTRKDIANIQAVERINLKGVASLSADFEQLYHATFSHSINPEFSLYGTKDGEQIYNYVHSERSINLNKQFLLFMGTPLDHYKKSLLTFTEMYNNKKDQLSKDNIDRVDMALLKANKLQEISELIEQFIRANKSTQTLLGNEVELESEETTHDEIILPELDSESKRILNSKNWNPILEKEYSNYLIQQPVSNESNSEYTGIVKDKYEYLDLLSKYDTLLHNFQNIKSENMVLNNLPDNKSIGVISEICMVLNLFGKSYRNKPYFLKDLLNQISNKKGLDDFVEILRDSTIYVLKLLQKDRQAKQLIFDYKNKYTSEIQSGISNFCTTYNYDTIKIEYEINYYFSAMKDILFNRKDDNEKSDYLRNYHHVESVITNSISLTNFYILMSESFLYENEDSVKVLPLVEYLYNDNINKNVIFKDIFKICSKSNIDLPSKLLKANIDTKKEEEIAIEDIKIIEKKLLETDMIEFQTFLDDKNEEFHFPKFKKYAWYNFEQKNKKIDI